MGKEVYIVGTLLSIVLSFILFLRGNRNEAHLRRPLGPDHPEPGPHTTGRRLDPTELAEQVREGDALDYGPSVRADRRELASGPLF